jgi:hypothetical protein
MNDELIFEEVENLYKIIPMKILRRTQKVLFDIVPVTSFAEKIGAVDRVIHEPGAISPGSVGNVERPWYMHTHQGDNLIVLAGERDVEIYTKEHGRIELFTVTPQQILKNGEIFYDKPAMLAWPRGAFHRIKSSDKSGSASINFAVHYEGFDIKTNFNIYDLNTDTGEYRIIREGHLDQPGSMNNG